MTTPSWYPDPMHRHELRWWDGQAWTAHVNDHGSAGHDPLFGSEPQHPAWAPPTIAPSADQAPPPIAAFAAPPATHPRRKALVVGGIIAIGALGIGAFFVTRHSSSTPTLGAATTLASNGSTVTTGARPTTTVAAATTTQPEQILTTPATSGTTTASSVEPGTAPTTATPTTATPTTPPPLPTYTAKQLVLALTSQRGVSASWTLEDNPIANPAAHTTGATCNGPNAVSRALANGSIAEAYGPAYHLPNGGWFGVDAYAFDTPAQADAFIKAGAVQASKCTTKPVVHRVSEKDLDMLIEPYFDGAVWSLVERGHAQTVKPEGSDHAVLVVESNDHVLKYGGYTFSYRGDELSHYERYGNVVLVFWRHGHNHFAGFVNDDPSWTFMPTNVELMQHVRAVRAGILAELG
ncbi:MAG: DUF2510 domain-containing protein [Actinomycetota bacterium]